MFLSGWEYLNILHLCCLGAVSDIPGLQCKVLIPATSLVSHLQASCVTAQINRSPLALSGLLDQSIIALLPVEKKVSGVLLQPVHHSQTQRSIHPILDIKVLNALIQAQNYVCNPSDPLLPPFAGATF